MLSFSPPMYGCFHMHFTLFLLEINFSFVFQDLTLLFLTSGRDPGILPRRAHPPQPEGYDANTEAGVGQNPQQQLPRTRDVVVNGIIVKVKYCDTCMLYRPPRCSHCSICDNCMERFDHHCPWVGQCIGLVSYRNIEINCVRFAINMNHSHSVSISLNCEITSQIQLIFYFFSLAIATSRWIFKIYRFY